MLWTSDVVKDPWFPLVKDPSGSMSSYHLSRFTRQRYLKLSSVQLLPRKSRVFYARTMLKLGR